MRFLITILSTLLLVSFTLPAPLIGSQSWVIERSSKLSIEGSSNINEFTCEIKEYMKQDTLSYMRDEKARLFLFTRSTMTIDVKRFDCHQSFITSDLRKTLKSDKYPCLYVRMISMDELSGSGPVKGKVEIEIAGQKKIMDIYYNYRPFGANQVELTGSKMMKFSDFKLEPPRKLAGLIHINEEIKVNFNLYFRKIV